MIKTSERAADLTRQLLAYSGRGHFEIQPININSFIRESEELFILSIPKTSKLVIDLTEEELVIEADKGQIQQVLMNLIINAGEAVTENGIITIATRRRTDFFREMLAISVADNGDGMPKEITKKIFDPFFSTKATGRGLGLSAVSGIVRGHKGHIEIDAEEGKGTKFTVYIPSTNLSIPRSPKQHLPTALSSLSHNKNILVIDDEPAVRQSIADIIEMMDSTPICAEDGETGLELFQESRSELDLILLDMTMPGINGIQVYQQLTSLGNTLPVVFMSGYTRFDIDKRMKLPESVLFLKKPFAAAKLLQTIEQAFTILAVPE